MGNIARHRRDEIRTFAGFEEDNSICWRRLGIICSRCVDIISGDSITMTYKVSMMFARNTGEGRWRDCRRSGRREGNSGRRISLGILAIIFDKAMR
jgi:hypothetical protein